MKQKKGLIILLVLLFIGTLWGCDSNKKPELPTEIPAVFKEQFKKLNLLHYTKGNFTGSGKDEYIVFYEDPRRRYEPDQRNIDKIMIFTMVDTGRPKLYEINDESSGPYDAEALRIVTNKKLHFGQWDGYCRIADYNKNGLDEVMFFDLAGLGFFVNIYEYHNGTMERVLESPPTYSLTISGIETITKNNKKYIKVYGSGGGEKPGKIIPRGYRDWHGYSWNREKGKYEIVDTGVEKWE
ncbi:MAG: hypothetical protein MUP30_12305 [Deltaproteobacteria bacterium]|nr:hypothetical protein [Deltaproteobacteria bacterium]